MQKVKTDTLTKGCRQVESALLGELSKPSNLHVQQPMKPDIRLADSYVTRRSWMKMAAGMAATGLLPRQMAAQSGTAAGSATSDSIVASDSAAIVFLVGRTLGFDFYGLERVLKISRAVLRRDGEAGVVAPQSKIHEGYSPSSRLAIRPAPPQSLSRSIFKTRS